VTPNAETITPRDQPVQLTPANQNRLLVVESVYYQGPHTDGVQRDSRFGRFLDTDEQPYLRVFVVKEEWQPLDPGWLSRAGMLLLVNQEGRFQVNPTEEQARTAAARVILLGVKPLIDLPPTPFARVRPRESCRLEPAGLDNLYVCCEKGEARGVLTLLPD
jgi:hypothetical protein